MTEGHLSEKEIQEYILNGAQSEVHVQRHMQSCPLCNSKAATYGSLFSVMSGAPAHAFDFDVAALVMPQVAPPVKRIWWKMPAFMAVTVLPFTIVAWFSGKYLLNEFAGQPIVVVFLVVVTAVLVLMLHLADMFKKYREQMRSYNFENSLQQ